MKKLFLLAAIAVLSINSVDAQNPNGKSRGTKLSTEERVEMRIKKLDAKLDLSGRQEKKIEDILKDFYAQKAEGGAKMGRNTLNSEISEVLDASQKEKFTQMCEAQRQKMQSHKGGKKQGMGKQGKKGQNGRGQGMRPGQGGRGKGMQAGKGAQQGYMQNLERLSQKLNLNSTQKEQLEAILKERPVKVEGQQVNREAFRTEKNAKIANILTPDQKKIFDEICVRRNK